MDLQHWADEGTLISETDWK